jgi:hypothetical protein
MRSHAIRAGTAMVLALGVFACGQPAENSGNEGTAQVRLMNAASGTPALDLVIGGKVIAGGIGYEQASRLGNAPAGNQTVAIRRAGETSDLTTKQIPLADGEKYTVVVSGSLASLTMTPSLVVDTGQAKPDRANIRVINISSYVFTGDSTNQPPPDLLNVYITAPGADLATSQPAFSLDARASSYSSLIYFDPGSYVVRFTPAGTTNVRAGTAATPIAAGQIRAITLQKLADGTWQTSVVAEQP